MKTVKIAVAIVACAIQAYGAATVTASRDYVDRKTNLHPYSNGVEQVGYVLGTQTNKVLASKEYVDDSISASSPGDYLNVSNKAYGAYNEIGNRLSSVAAYPKWEPGKQNAGEYVVGEIVSYSGLLYRCTAGTSGTSTPDVYTNAWTGTTIGNLIAGNIPGDYNTVSNAAVKSRAKTDMVVYDTNGVSTVDRLATTGDVEVAVNRVRTDRITDGTNTIDAAGNVYQKSYSPWLIYSTDVTNYSSPIVCTYKGTIATTNIFTGISETFNNVWVSAEEISLGGAEPSYFGIKPKDGSVIFIEAPTDGIYPLWSGDPLEMSGENQIIAIGAFACDIRRQSVYEEKLMGKVALTNEIPTVDYSTSNAHLVATIEATAPAPGNYSAVSNRAMSARSVIDLGVRGAPGNVRVGSWFVVNSTKLTFTGNKWEGGIYVIEVAPEDSYTLYVYDVNEEEVGTFSLDENYSSNEIEGYKIIGYVDTIAKESQIPDVPTAYEGPPQMDGGNSGSAGTTNAWARGDHRHPTDESLLKSEAVYPAWTISPSNPYQVGDIVTHIGYIFRCSENGTSDIPGVDDEGWEELTIPDFFALKQDALPYPTNAIPYAVVYGGPNISPSDQTFSNAVLAVGIGIDTNTVAAINALVEQDDELPIGGAATVGALILALAAAVAALKKGKADLQNGTVPTTQLPVWDGSYTGGEAPPHEQWIFTLNDGTTVTKEVALWPSST